MTRPHVPAEVWAEVLAAAEWYEAQLPGLGADLLRAIDECLDRVAEHPLQFPVVDDAIRRARSRRFLFGVFFRVRGEDVLVIAIQDQRRSEQRWKRRKPRW